MEVEPIAVRLTRLGSVHQNLRTDSVDGVTSDWPQVGKRFRMFGDSLTPGGICRMIDTSPIFSIEDIEAGAVLEFRTQNSHYRLERICLGAARKEAAS